LLSIIICGFVPIPIFPDSASIINLLFIILFLPEAIIKLLLLFAIFHPYDILLSIELLTPFINSIEETG